MSSAFAALVRRTPLVALPGLEGISVKLECLQRTGSFKLRGACLRLDALSAEERRRGVVAASAGNHGLGVALAGRALGVRVKAVVPATSPVVKRRGIAELGALVIEGGADYQAAEDEARRIALTSGALFVSPFDDPWIMRGNGGSLADEILAELPDTRRIVCTIGGGGLAAGLAEAAAARGVRVIGVQPAGNCAMHESLRMGRALTRYTGAATLAEGCEGGVAESTFSRCRAHGVTTVLVEEQAIRRAIARAYRLGWLVEPTAAVALAGLLEGVVTAEPGTVLVLTGGNVEPELLGRVLAEG